jgi:acetate kinase
VTTLRILVLNAGSSSLKASLIELPQDRAGSTVLAARAVAEVAWGADSTRVADRPARVAELVDRLRAEAGGEPIDAVGHRVVHGGSRFRAPALVDETVLEGIRAVRELAPLHNGVALDAIEAARSALPEVPHVACFDTAFHATLPEEAWRYPLPRDWHDRFGVRRYGFHGLSVAWAADRAAALSGRPMDDLGLVVAHLGSGCSVTAVQDGRSVDTSMGWTPLEGLMMGTRAGSVDPGILVRLLEAGSVTARDLGGTLDHGSGLLAVAGTADMRSIVAAAEAGEAPATLALRMFVRRVAAGIAAAATSLERLDAIVFTAGIGERSARVRAEVVARLGALGVGAITDPEGGEDAVVSEPEARVTVLRIGAREDLVIARETAALIAGR